MRVLVLVARDRENPALGGGEIVLAEFAKALVRKGHEVELLCAKFPGCATATLIDGVHVRRLAGERALGPAAFFEYRNRYRGRVDVILEEILGGSRIPFFAPLYVREPLVAVWQQDHIPIFRQEYSRLLLPALTGLERGLVWAHRRSFFLVPSEMSRDSLVSKGADPSRVRVFHPGIPDALLRDGPPPPSEARSPRIVCLGKIRRYKCQHHAILVLREVLRTNPRATLEIAGRVGDRDYFDEMRALAQEPDVRDKVAFELNVSEERKRELLRTSRALVAPAPIEGFGIAIVEANACGLPVVGTTGVPEDALREGENGFRVPFADVASMAERAGRLLEDNALFDGLSRRCAAFARAFTWERAAEPLLDLLRQLADRRR